MLFQLLDKLTGGISKLELSREVPRFASQVRDSLSPLFEEMASRGAKEETIGVLAQGIAAVALKEIQMIPGIVSTMTEAIGRRTTNPAISCVMAATLAYVVQPHDLIPDNAPGGFGLVDDYILLQAGHLELLSSQRKSESERGEVNKKLMAMTSLLPSSLRPVMQEAVNGLSTLIQLVGALPTDMQVWTTQMIIANPLQGAITPAPAGFAPQPGFQLGGLTPSMVWEGQHTWRDGDRIGVMFPGGGGVVSDGKDIIPI